MNDEALTAFCNALPGSTLEFPWNQPTWKVGGKMFCGRSGMGSRIMLKATLDQQAALIMIPGVKVASYVGHHGWIEAEMTEVDDGLLEDLIRESHRQVVAKLPKAKRP
jgi:predicted DNA-binding protein (MmcQ/YjbR family)